MDRANLWAEITKSEKQDDGTLLVHGVVSDETLDVDQQIADSEWLKTALPAWFTWGNIREMHGALAAGVATELSEKDGAHSITAKVVDPGSIKKVEQGVLKGFSIGIKAPRIVVDKAAAGGRLVGGQIVEVSLVDRPANPSCTLTITKTAAPGVENIAVADFDAERKLVRVEELTEKALDPAVVKIAAGMTANSLRDSLEQAVSNGYATGDDQWAWVCDWTDEWVVYQIDGPTSGCFKQAYTVNADGTVTLAADRTEVVRTNTYTPVAAKSADTDRKDPAVELAEAVNIVKKAHTSDAVKALVADLNKAADPTAPVEPATPATEPATPETSDSTKTIEPDTTKAITADTLKSAVAEAISPFKDDVLARLEKVEKAAAPGGPVRMRTTAQIDTSARHDELVAKAAQAHQTARSIDDPQLRAEYDKRAREYEAELAKLRDSTIS